MLTATHSSLQHFISRYSDDRQLAELGHRLSTELSADALLDIYQQAIPMVERQLWADQPDEASISLYQKIFQEMEAHLAASRQPQQDERHKFYIVIPVADRPIHLQECLNSLLEICRCYHYGGAHDQTYKKVSVIVADDSKNCDSMAQHKKLCEQFSSQGLHTEYFGIDEQIAQIKMLGRSAENLQQILGSYATNPDPANFYHKGSAITRNIAYLRLKQISLDETEKVIFYFIDSDQTFKIKIATATGQIDIYAINYFHQLNEIFSRGNVSILTGKVVGDPPVSPAVMAGNFQNDVIDFLQQMALQPPSLACGFHPALQAKSDAAAYHDMAQLFGFKPSAQAFHYSCTLSGPHQHVACFNDFASKLNRFFDGEHPTRITYFDYDKPLSETLPARTIYTGNYAFKAESLDYFISFATLKLRMGGPVLGRIIKTEIGDRFVSANLPMLHKRTTDATGESEFRPGVHRERQIIDLADEFERQFFGDVMLFTIEKLCAQGYPQQPVADSLIEHALNETERDLQQRYEQRHQQIMQRLETLKTVFSAPENWWHQHADTARSINAIRRFIDNVEHNFGRNAQGYALINSADNQKKRHAEILRAITHYQQDRACWAEIMR